MLGRTELQQARAVPGKGIRVWSSSCSRNRRAFLEVPHSHGAVTSFIAPSCGNTSCLLAARRWGTVVRREQAPPAARIGAIHSA